MDNETKTLAQMNAIYDSYCAYENILKDIETLTDNEKNELYLYLYEVVKSKFFTSIKTEDGKYYHCTNCNNPFFLKTDKDIICICCRKYFTGV